MQKLSEKEIKQFQEKILSWYEKNKRDLPWRRIFFDTKLQQRDPYKILVSEIMAQQTQLSRVIPKYEAWLERFPTIESLAEAPTREVLLYWSGLGYNSRALNLQKTAKMLVDRSLYSRHSPDFRGNPSPRQTRTDPRIREDDNIVWPRTYEELIKLPGIGKYTANALLCFAFNQQVAVVDTNVRKVILIEFELNEDKAVFRPHPLSISSEEREVRGKDYFDGPHPNPLLPGAGKEKKIEEVANLLLPKGRAYEWNQALMDYAAAMLKDKKIPLPKQTPFRTSNRYYRGHTMKLLVQKHSVSFSTLWKYFKAHNPIEKNRLKQILQQMEKDGLVKIEGEIVRII